MTEKDQKLLAEFETRMKQLISLCDILREENKILRDEMSQKNIKIESLSEEVKQLKTKYDNLKLVKALSGQDIEVAEESKKRLSKLVRDVDKCIALLKG